MGVTHIINGLGSKDNYQLGVMLIQAAGRDDRLLTLTQAYGKFSIKLIIPLLYIIMCQGVHVFGSSFPKGTCGVLQASLS